MRLDDVVSSPPPEPSDESGEIEAMSRLLLTAILCLAVGAVIGWLVGSPEDVASGRLRIVGTAAAVLLSLYAVLDHWEPYLEGFGTGTIRRCRKRMKLIVPMVALGTAMAVAAQACFDAEGADIVVYAVCVIGALFVLLYYAFRARVSAQRLVDEGRRTT